MPSGGIKAYVEELLTEVSFVDIDGRKMGYDYAEIAERLKARFPEARLVARKRNKRNGLVFKYRILQDWYAPNLQRTGARLPIRCRSRRILARDFSRMLLLKETNGIGLTLRHIRRRVRNKFPEVPPLDLKKVEARLRSKGYPVPLRGPFYVAE